MSTRSRPGSELIFWKAAAAERAPTDERIYADGTHTPCMLLGVRVQAEFHLVDHPLAVPVTDADNVEMAPRSVYRVTT